MAFADRPNEGGGDVAGIVAVGRGVILPPWGYEEPVYEDVICPPGVWVQLASRDIQRAAVMVFREPTALAFKVRGGGSAVAQSFDIRGAESVLALRYVDFLTIVTGDVYGLSIPGETVTVATIRSI